MDTIFTIGDLQEDNVKINLDDLYEKKKQKDLQTVQTYNRILSRIHNKIKLLAKQNIANQHCFYIVPEIIIGVPKYNTEECTAYIIHKLRENGFVVRYTHPNLLFISWKHWLPSYVRNEIKKKTGNIYDGYGNKIDKNSGQDNEDDGDINNLMLKKRNNSTPVENKKFTSIEQYKPTGNLIYNEDLLVNIEKKTK